MMDFDDKLYWVEQNPLFWWKMNVFHYGSRQSRLSQTVNKDLWEEWENSHYTYLGALIRPTLSKYSYFWRL